MPTSPHWAPTNSPELFEKTGAFCRVDAGIDPYEPPGKLQKNRRGGRGFPPFGSYEFSVDFRKNRIFCGRTEASAPTGFPKNLLFLRRGSASKILYRRTCVAGKRTRDWRIFGKSPCIVDERCLYVASCAFCPINFQTIFVINHSFFRIFHTFSCFFTF